MTTQPTTTVSVDIELNLVVPDGGILPVDATLRYDAADPYAVHVGFYTGAEDLVEWAFARQLLTDGVSAPVGDGDVQVWPAHGVHEPLVCLALSSPTGAAVFEVRLGQLVEFLTRTYTAVPTGSESDHLDLDAELALLLWSDTAE